MGFLQGKRILVTGLLSNRSIAYGIAKACRREGAELAFTYQGEGVRERVAELAGEFGARSVLPCDVADDAQIEALFAELGKSWDGLDGLVHAIAFAPREAISGELLDGLSRENHFKSWTARLYGYSNYVTPLPLRVLVDREGVIRYKGAGGPALEQTVAKLMGARKPVE